MQKSGKKNNRRKKNLVLLCAFTAIILTVSTYAWFIGMRTVNVAAFEVNIASTKSLLLSIDGENWTDTLTINGENYNTAAYEGNTNSWEKLIPVSTIGDMDKTSSRMKLYEKSSMTTTPGGYRLMAYPVQNNGAKEVKGYVAFDLFIKNFTGSKYYIEMDQNNEEAVYLTTNSKVGVAAAGVAGTGIENSVRVAFAQIGRVIGTSTDKTLITGINCTGNSDTETDENKAITGICRNATIWEPNDLAHVKNAISWYETSCKTRKAEGNDVTKIDSYNADTACSGVVDGQYAPTYAVAKEIKAEDNVDVYDGAKYNTYTKSTDGETPLIKEFDYVTDTEKNLKGVDRPEFMSLAPNSITKVRVYIYIEGQDIDNYDFASIGKMISVNFGFTKERMEPEDIDYEGEYFEKCEGGTVPTTKTACTAANGTWTATGEGETDGTCSGHTKAYCDAIGGTYSTTSALTGICYNEAGTNAFANKEACDGVTGEWDGTTCRVTEAACKANADTNKWSGN